MSDPCKKETELVWAAMSTGEILVGWLPGHEIKKTSVSKKEKKDQLSNAAAALKQLNRENRARHLP